MGLVGDPVLHHPLKSRRSHSVVRRVEDVILVARAQFSAADQIHRYPPHIAGQKDADETFPLLSDLAADALAQKQTSVFHPAHAEPATIATSTTLFSALASSPNLRRLAAGRNPGPPHLIATATPPPDSSASAKGSSFQGAATWPSCAIEIPAAIDSSQQYPLPVRRGKNVASSAVCRLRRTAFASRFAISCSIR